MGTFADIKSDVRATRRIPLLNEERIQGGARRDGRGVPLCGTDRGYPHPAGNIARS
jgi:hypothetical protein